MIEEAERREEEGPRFEAQFKKGDRIKVTNGAFINFEGDVDEVIPDKGMVRIITTIFGRPRRWSWNTGRSRRCECGRDHGTDLMLRLIQFSGKAQRLSGNLLGLPLWARVDPGDRRPPGIDPGGLVIGGGFVSLFALLLLTVPAYRLLWVLAGGQACERRSPSAGVEAGPLPPGFGSLAGFV